LFLKNDKLLIHFGGGDTTFSDGLFEIRVPLSDTPTFRLAGAGGSGASLEDLFETLRF
jgi:hypothetical protein